MCGRGRQGRLALVVHIRKSLHLGGDGRTAALTTWVRQPNKSVRSVSFWGEAIPSGTGFVSSGVADDCWLGQEWQPRPATLSDVGKDGVGLPGSVPA